MNKIILSGLRANCIIGVKPGERKAKQELIFDIILSLNLSRAAVSDDIKDTVDYQLLSDQIIAFVEKSQFRLIEKLAREVAGLAKNCSRAEQVKVKLCKPAALSKADCVCVEVKL